MILALQLKSPNFLTNLRNELRTLIQLPGTPVVPEGAIAYIDAIVVEKNTTMAVAAPDPKNTRGVPTIDNQNQKHPTANLDAVIHVDQPVTVRSYTFDQLDHAANQGENPGPTKDTTYDLNLELAIDLSGAVPALLASLISVTRQGKEIHDVEQEIAAFLSPNPVPLDFSSLGFLNDVGLIKVTRGGISVSTTGTPTVAFELENPSDGPTPSPLWDWTAFNAPGPSVDLLQGSDFGIILDGRILADLLAGLTSEGLKDKVDQNELKLNSSPTGVWTTDRAVVTFSGAVVDACVFLFFTHNLNFDSTMQLIPLVPQENTIRLDLTADFSTNPFDDLVCAFSSATFPLNVVNRLQQGQLDAGAAAAISLAHFFGGFEGFMSIFNGTLVAIGQQDPLADFKKQHPDVVVPASTTHDSEVFLDQTLKLPALPGGTPFIDAIAPNPLGPVLQGRVSPTPHDSTSFPLSIYLIPIAWANRTDCALDPTVKAEIDPNCNVVHAEVIEDALKQFSPYLQVQEFSVTISIPQAAVLPAYLASPYSCKVLLFTSLGVRIIDLGTFPAISNAIITGLKASIAADPNCQGLGSSQLGTGKWIIDWLGDPSPDPFETHLWTLGFTSLGADNVLTVQSPAGQSLAIANAINSQAQASLLTTFQNLPAAATSRGDSLTVLRRGAPMSLRPQQRSIRVTQTTLRTLSQMVLDDACGSLELAAERGTPLAIGIFPGGLSVWSLHPGSNPRLRFQLPADGLAGALLLDGRYIIWGQDGIYALHGPDPRWSSSMVRGPDGPIFRVIPSGSGFLALAPSKLIRIDAGLRPVAEVPLTNAFNMAPAGRFAIIATNTGITLIDASVPTLSAAHSITRAVGAVGPARVAGHAGVFYTLESSGAHSILEFTSTGQIQLLNTYTEEPWFVASRTLGSILVQLSPLRGNLSVYQVGQGHRRRATGWRRCSWFLSA